MAGKERSQRVFRFKGRSMTDAARRARQELGDATALLDVQTIREESGEERVEIAVAVLDRVGIPSLVEFLTRSAKPAAVPAQITQDVWPPRFQKLWNTLVEVGVREDQADILCRESIEAASELDAGPWDTVETVVARFAPCSPPLDLSVRQVFGLTGKAGVGRTTVAQEICRMAGEIVPDRILLISSNPAVVSEAGFEVVALENASEAAHAVSFQRELRVVVVDLPIVKETDPRLGMGPWLSEFPDLVLLPVVSADRPLSDAVSTINRCAEHRSTGWIMTGVDSDARLGIAISLALATGGPLGLQGRTDEVGEPRLQLARWSNIFERLQRFAEGGAPRSAKTLREEGG